MKNYTNGKLGTIEVTRRIGISPERLRYWERRGIVKPKHIKYGRREFRRYSPEDLHRATLIKAFVDTEKYTLKTAIKKLREEEQE